MEELRRVVVIGTTGTGKSTFAASLAAIIGAEVISLDEISFLPGWKKREKDDYDLLVRQALQAECWVVDGNTRRSRQVLWQQADAVIWLNYSFWVNFSRLLGRTLRRIWRKEEVFPGCVENFWMQFFSADSILLWFFKTFWKRRKTFRQAFAQPEYARQQKLVFTSPRQANQFLESLARVDGSA